MKRPILSCLVAGLLAGATAPAFAMSASIGHSVRLDGFTYGPATIVTLQSAAPGVAIAPFGAYAGQYVGTLDGQTFYTYCAEITQALSFHTLYTDFTIVDGVSAWGVETSAMLDHLVSAYETQHLVSDAIGSGFAQAGIWEAINETTPSLALGNGSFRVTSSANALIQSLSTDWHALSTSPVLYHVSLLHSPTAQDLLMINAVPGVIPEPPVVALMLSGLAGVALARRRRAAVRS